ncbi:bifunctional nuclease family protein [Cyanobium sp. HWJ4-Hawea]|uniref:bifunctional nuclease family protein n=1 Tax=Cyanobium sp. HWJ4-Hawea TaxID=2823713 RepID=UPI0020CC3476|nr:bifunctional nuclease family protein [Cyanobium sp. HWJ4-Hawea]MCP9807842.1 bifunctional nuclease family protein [Cyanobium sp. HWJ4-Hawea]
MVEMRVAGIALDAASRSPIVLLRDPAGRRQVPIWIDQAQAQNILAGLGDETPPRPLSHDLMATLLEAGGLQLDRVIIHAIEESTFRAVLKLSPCPPAEGESTQPLAEEESLEIDARPSDAIALALRTGSSIWMLEEVVADASIPVDAEADAEDREDFRRFLDSTSPADLVRHLSRAQPDVIPEDGPPEEKPGETGGD